MTRITATLIAAFWAASIATPSVAETGTVTVLHGTGKTAGARTTTGAVTVLRGTPVVARPSQPTEKPPTAATEVIAAGETLWLRHARTGQLIACWAGNSIYAGRFAIYCARTGRY